MLEAARSTDIRAGHHLRSIDGARGIAVLAVALHHAFRSAPNAPGSPFPYWPNCGARGVDLFFVISGFCLSYPYFTGRSLPAPSYASYGAFLGRRYSRIAPAYYVALALFVALSFTSFGVPGHTTPGPFRNTNVAEIAREAVFLTSRAPLYNASFWTLGIEMRWYLLCPLLLALFFRSRSAFGAVAIALYAIYLGTPWGVADAGTLPCFMLGIVAARAVVSEWPLVTYAPLVAPVILTFALWMQAHSSGVDHGDPLWHIACFLVLLAIVRIQTPLWLWPLRLVGSASYSIYLVNWPVTAWLEERGASPFVAALVALALGIGFWAGVERALRDARLFESLKAALHVSRTRATL